MGEMNQFKGARPDKVLTDFEVRRIRARWLDGQSASSIAKAMHTSMGRVRELVADLPRPAPALKRGAARGLSRVGW